MPFELNNETPIDPLYHQTKKLITRGELKNDIKAVQYHFRIGYNRARRILESIKLNHSLIE